MDKLVKVPAVMLERAAELVPAVKDEVPGAALRWTQTAVVRLALEYGLTYIEQTLGAGGELLPPKPNTKPKPSKRSYAEQIVSAVEVGAAPKPKAATKGAKR